MTTMIHCDYEGCDRTISETLYGTVGLGGESSGWRVVEFPNRYVRNYCGPYHEVLAAIQVLAPEELSFLWAAVERVVRA